MTITQLQGGENLWLLLVLKVVRVFLFFLKVSLSVFDIFPLHAFP